MTTLGLLSDSHGRAQTTHTAIDLLLDHGADVLIHLGDIGTVQVLDALAAIHPGTGEQIEAHIVFGNTDWDFASLQRYAQDLGIHAHSPYGLQEWDGCRVGFTHGHQPAVTQHLLDSGVDYLLQGHTHILEDRDLGGTRLINPGALFRAQRHTAAVLKPSVGQLKVVEVAGVAR